MPGKYGYQPEREEEGIMFDGWWFSCDEMQEICRKRMEAFDRQPKYYRDRVNEKGK